MSKVRIGLVPETTELRVENETQIGGGGAGRRRSALRAAAAARGVRWKIR